MNCPPPKEPLICRLGSFADVTVKRKIGPLARAPSLALQILRRMRRQKDIFAFVVMTMVFAVRLVQWGQKRWEEGLFEAEAAPMGGREGGRGP